MRRWFTGLLVISLMIGVFPAQADWKINKDGTVTKSQILGDETSESEDQEKEEEEKVEIEKEEKKGEKKESLEVQKGSIKLKIEREGDVLKVKGRDQNGKEFELETKKDEKVEMEDEDIEIASGSGTTIKVTRGEIEAETELPISVDTVTKELSIGGKSITVLPDDAVKNAFTDTSLTAKTKVEIKSRGEEMVYEINREEKKKLFGLFDLTFNKFSVVSADSGKVLENTQAWWSSLLESLSR